MTLKWFQATSRMVWSTILFGYDIIALVNMTVSPQHFRAVKPANIWLNNSMVSHFWQFKEVFFFPHKICLYKTPQKKSVTCDLQVISYMPATKQNGRPAVRKAPSALPPMCFLCCRERTNAVVCPRCGHRRLLRCTIKRQCMCYNCDYFKYI